MTTYGRRDLTPSFLTGEADRLTRRRLLRTGLAATGAALAWPAVGPRSGTRGEVAVAQDELILWGDHPEWREPMLSLVQAFYDDTQIGVAFELWPRNDYLAQLDVVQGGGSEPDVFGLFAGSMVQQYADNQRIVDLTDHVPVDGLITSALAQITYADRVWGCPLGSFTIAWFYRRAVFAELGLELPTSWDDLYGICQALQDGGVTPIMMPAADAVAPYYFLMLAASANVGQAGMESSYRGLPSITPADLAEAAQLLVDLRPYFYGDFASIDYETGQSWFANGEAAMAIAGSWTYSGPSALLTGDEIGVFGFPSSRGEPPATVTGMELVYAVNAASGREEANRFVAWLADVKAQKLVANLMALPVHRDVVPEMDAIAREIVSVRQAGIDLPVWYAFPEADRSFEAVAGSMAFLLDDTLSPSEFADRMFAEGLVRGSDAEALVVHG